MEANEVSRHIFRQTPYSIILLLKDTRVVGTVKYLAGYILLMQRLCRRKS